MHGVQISKLQCGAHEHVPGVRKDNYVLLAMLRDKSQCVCRSCLFAAAYFVVGAKGYRAQNV